jgi:hypothetical protein
MSYVQRMLLNACARQRRSQAQDMRGLLLPPPRRPPYQPTPNQRDLLLPNHSLAIVRHRKPRILGIRKRHTSRLTLTRNTQLITHKRTTLCTIHHKLRRRYRATLQRHSAKQRLRSPRRGVDVDGAGAGRRDGVSCREVDFELAAVGAGGDVGEGVDGEADGLGVGDLAGAAGEGGGWRCWCGGGEEGGAQESADDGDVLHVDGLMVVVV